ncbi:hypothetical protein APED_32005 [Acanthopleuribacter pedis]
MLTAPRGCASCATPARFSQTISLQTFSQNPSLLSRLLGLSTKEMRTLSAGRPVFDIMLDGDLGLDADAGFFRVGEDQHQTAEQGGGQENEDQ